MSTIDHPPPAPSRPQRSPDVVITAFRPREHCCLIGHVDVRIPGYGLTVHGVGVQRLGGHYSVIPPGLGASRRALFVELLWLDEQALPRFERAVLDELRATYPDALADGEAAR